MVQRRSLNAFIDGNTLVVELAEDWNLLPCSTPAINQLSPTLPPLPARHRKGGTGDGDEVQGDRRWTQTPLGKESQAAAWTALGRDCCWGDWGHMNLNGLVFPSPEQKKRCKLQCNLNQGSFMKVLPSCQKMLPLVSSSAPWDKAPPASPLPSIWPLSLPPAPSTGGYTFDKHGGAQQNL